MAGNRELHKSSEFEINEKRGDELYNFLNKLKDSELILKTYELMNKRNIDYINLTLSNQEICIEELSPHTIGELILKKDKGFFTRYYDADMPFSFLSKIKPLEIRFHNLKENLLEERIKLWNKEGISYGDSTVSYYHPEPINE